MKRFIVLLIILAQYEIMQAANKSDEPYIHNHNSITWVDGANGNKIALKMLSTQYGLIPDKTKIKDGIQFAKGLIKGYAPAPYIVPTPKMAPGSKGFVVQSPADPGWKVFGTPEEFWAWQQTLPAPPTAAAAAMPAMQTAQASQPPKKQLVRNKSVGKPSGEKSIWAAAAKAQGNY